MSDRRRRRAKEDDSDEESQHSEVESGSEAGASNDEVELPSYDEAVKLEAENNVPASGSKREVRKPRVEGRIAKQDPSTVPRSERFFLHDDREGEKSGGMRSGRKFEGKSEPERPQRSGRKSNNDDSAWKHDKFEELMANEPQQQGSNSGSCPGRTIANRNRHLEEAQQASNVEQARSDGNQSRGREKDSSRPGKANSRERSSATNTAGSAPVANSRSDGRNQNSRGPPSATTGSEPSYRYSEHDDRAPRNREAGGERGGGRRRGGGDRTSTGGRNSSDAERNSKPSTRGPPALVHSNNNSNSNNYTTSAQSNQRGGGERSRGDARQKQQQQEPPQRLSSRRVERVDGPTPGGAQNPGQQGAAPLVQTVRVSMPIKPPPGFKGPPGLDTVALNPSARVFQPTDDSPRGSNSGSASKAERRNKAPAESYYEPGFDYSTAVHNASHVQAQLQHQQHTTYYPLPVSAGVTTTTSATTSAAGATYADTTPSVTSAPSAAVPAAVSASPLPVTQPMPYGSPQPVPYSVPQSDYRGRRGNSNSNNNMSGSEVDMYGHPHTANGHGMGMYRGHGQQSGVPMQMQAGYMNVPVYDSSIYMNDHSHMQVQGMAGGVPMYMADGSLWYPTISQNMQQSSMQNMHGVVPGIPADGTTGGTVYYPLPPQPSTTD